MLYSLLVYLLLFTPATIWGKNVILILLSPQEDFNSYIMAMLHVVYIHHYWVIPLINWREASRAASYLNSWTQFQEQYERAIGVPLQLSLRRRIWWLIALAVFITVLTNMVRFNYIDGWNVLPALYLHFLLNMLAVLWHVDCKALSQAADGVRESLQEAINYEGVSSTMVQRRLLWLRLSQLIQLHGDQFSNTYSHYFLLMFVALVAGAYGVICDVTQSGFNTDQPWVVSVLLHSGAMLYVLCDSAHVATYKAGAETQEMILFMDLSSVNPHTRSEVELLLTSMTLNPPAITLRGHVSVNRSMLVSLMSTVVTYLVVLLQFKLGWTTPAKSPTCLNSTVHGNGSITCPGFLNKTVALPQVGDNTTGHRR